MTTNFAPTQRQAWAAATVSLVGWSLDLFDLFILLYIAPTIGRLFFPTESPTLSLASVYASFAVTLLMRPVGSAVFGSYADRHGRRAGLLISIVGVSVTTGFLGCLPTYRAIGVAAPIIFILVRLMQGVFVGGVVASTHTLGTETVAPRLRGLFSGVMASGAGLGALLASGAFTFVTFLYPGPSFDIWGWRLMFWIGMACAALSLLLFRRVEESPLWRQTRPADRLKTPLQELFGQHARVLTINMLITIGAGSSYYLTVGFLPVYLIKVAGMPQATAGVVLIVTSIVIVLVSPALGHLSEVFGRKSTMMVTAIANAVFLPLLFIGLRNSVDVYMQTFIASLIVTLGSSGCAIALIYLNERFPTAIRSSGTALSWNIGYAVGGLMPTLVTVSSATVGDIPTSLSVGLIIVNVVFFAGTILTPETRGSLSHTGAAPAIDSVVGERI